MTLRVKKILLYGIIHQNTKMIFSKILLFVWFTTVESNQGIIYLKYFETLTSEIFLVYFDTLSH